MPGPFVAYGELYLSKPGDVMAMNILSEPFAVYRGTGFQAVSIEMAGLAIWNATAAFTMLSAPGPRCTSLCTSAGANLRTSGANPDFRPAAREWARQRPPHTKEHRKDPKSHLGRGDMHGFRCFAPRTHHATSCDNPAVRSRFRFGPVIAASGRRSSFATSVVKES